MRGAALDELTALMETISAWSSQAKGLVFYIYGSRVRGDHRPDSDVDLYIRITADVDDPTGDWFCEQNKSDFATLNEALPGRLELLDGPQSLKRAIENAPPYRVLGKVVAVCLPPKPTQHV